MQSILAEKPRSIEQIRELKTPEEPNDRIKKYLSLFKLDDKPITWSPNQYEIVTEIVFRIHPRVECIAVTQYGKSLAVACALIISAAMLGEKWAIVAPTADKAGIIMGYVIDHLFDHPLFLSQLEYDQPLAKLKQERSKTRITFKRGGEIRIFSADAKNRKALTKSLTGFGSKNIVLDESSLIPNDLYAMVKRMLGGNDDNFLFEIGNPFERNHFLRTWKGGDYYRIYIDYLVAIAEGRFTEAFVNEMRQEAFFDVLYECVFPKEDEILDGGWRRIITSTQVEAKFVDEWNPEGYGRLGIDVAGGGKDFTVATVRFENTCKVVARWSDKDLMAQIPIILDIMRDYNIDPVFVFIDDTAIGQGLTNRMNEMNYDVNGVKLGARAVESDKYANIRAEDHWLCSQWLKESGTIYKNEYSEALKQLSLVRYKEDTNSKLKLEPKEQMQIREGIKSPDEVDSLILTFSNTTVITEDDFGF